MGIMKKIFSNIMYNGIYQLLIIVLPFITVPYISRVLGAESVGVYSYVNSIPTFLSVVILMGMNQLGAREIAQSNRETIWSRFLGLWKIQAFVGVVVIILYTLVVIFTLDYKFYFLLEVPFLIGYILDISWFFIGLGEIKKVVIRNTSIKLILITSIFIFVHNPDDLWIYVLINSITYLANIIFWFSLKHEIKLIQTIDITPTKIKFNYWKKAIIVAIPMIATQLYTSFDQTLVKWLAGAVQLAYYSQSQMIARAVVGVVTSVSMVLMPKMAQIQASGDSENHNKSIFKLVKISLDYTAIVALYFTAALMINSAVFVPWFYGTKFTDMTQNMFWVSLIVIFISYGGVFANQYTLSQGKYVKFAIPYLIGAIFSILANIFLVPLYGSLGATGVIVGTELIVCLLRIVLVIGDFKKVGIFNDQLKYILTFIITLGLGLLLPIRVSNPLVTLIAQTILSTIVYFVLLIVLKTRVTNDGKQLLRRIKR
ncbi:polysaccharide biosynthesis family protein [Latilactobacillus sakei subsp. carnosus DSM 15831]|nr:oligosaccharide flippase family protein [Latilactobacillus sakei]KRL71245.1 polysaccharide biosynthesis family protein [Latilactobacillus sakei subsp. carnosus DSM 15831]GEP21941.1 capsular polysaccharide biosynthesis protein [Latilactobacillus sakei subsp. carnosus]